MNTPALTHMVGVALVDENLRYTYVNPLLASYHDQFPEDYHGNHIAKMIPPNIFEVVAPLYKYVLATSLSIDCFEFCSRTNSSIDFDHWRASYRRVPCGVCATMVRLNSMKKQEALIDALTQAEDKILRFLGTGRSTKEIATELGLSTHTIATHRKHICRKLQVHSTSELIAVATLLRVSWKLHTKQPICSNSLAQSLCPSSPVLLMCFQIEIKCVNTDS